MLKIWGLHKVLYGLDSEFLKRQGDPLMHSLAKLPDQPRIKYSTRLWYNDMIMWVSTGKLEVKSTHFVFELVSV